LKVTLYVIWFAVSASDAIGALLASLYLLKIKSRFGKFLGIVLIGITIEALIAATSLMLFWQVEVVVQPEFALMRVIGRSIKSVCVWALVLYLLNICNSGRVEKIDV